MRWLRWQGLVAFVVVVGGLATLWVVFADRFVEWAVESAGTAMVGARVDLDGADVGLAPLRIELHGLQVTNPRSPMRNAFQAQRIAFDADTMGYLLDRVDIREVAVEGVQLNTQRQSSGAVAQTPDAGEGLLERTTRRLEIPSLELPTVEQALAAADLRSPEVIRSAEQAMVERRKALAQRVEALPSEQKVAGYEQRLDKLRGGSGDLGGRLAQARDAKALLEDVRSDLKAVRKARDAARESVQAAGENAERARRAPGEDVKRLYEKYSDPATVAQELARYVLGPRVAGWINGGWYWYQQLAPYLGRLQSAGDDAPPAAKTPRGTGRRVLFPEADPRPSTLVRKVTLSGGEGGRLSGKITDIAAPAQLWPKPLAFDISGRGLPGLNELTAEGRLNRASGQPRTRIKLALKGAALEGPEADVQGVALAGGLADLTVDGDVVFAVGESAGPRSREIARALEGVQRFDLRARVTGTAADPQLSLQSGLADALKGLVGQVAQDKARAFRAGLEAQISQRVTEPLQSMESSLDQLEALNADIKAREERLEALQERLKPTGG